LRATAEAFVRDHGFQLSHAYMYMYAYGLSQFHFVGVRSRQIAKSRVSVGVETYSHFNVFARYCVDVSVS
jgi:hypothetical protein